MCGTFANEHPPPRFHAKYGEVEAHTSNKGLRRNFQLMPGAQWLNLLCRHIPDRFEHLVRYAGWYSNRSRGKRGGSQIAPDAGIETESDVAEAPRARSAWARLIHKVYEFDPLQFPRCGGPMRVIALIEDPETIRKILVHLELWMPRQQERAPPPVAPPAQAATTSTYHPVPDIA